MNELVVVDLETTGLSGTMDHIVEIAYGSLIQSEDRTTLGTISQQLIKPPISITPDLSAIHHITDRDVELSPTLDSIQDSLKSAFEGKIMVAHNAKFEKSFMNVKLTPGNRWICTWKCAVVAWPDSPKHSNIVLGYYLGIIKGRSEAFHAAHTAAYDVSVTRQILEKLLEKYTIAQLLQISGEEVLLSKIPFGKYKGVEFKDLPNHYLKWLTTEAMGVRYDVLEAANTEIARRSAVTQGSPG